MNADSDEKKQTERTLDEILIRKIGEVIDDIDQLKISVVENRMGIIYLPGRFDFLFTLIASELPEKDIEKYLSLKRDLESMQIIKRSLLNERGIPAHYGKPTDVIIEENWGRYNLILKKIELHVWGCLNSIGLGFKKKKKVLI